MFRRRSSRSPMSSSSNLSSAAARIARSACSLKKSKNFPSRGRRRTIADFTRSQGGAIIAPRALKCSIELGGRKHPTRATTKCFASSAKRAILWRQLDERERHDNGSECHADRGAGRRLLLVRGGGVRSTRRRAVGRVRLCGRTGARSQLRGGMQWDQRPRRGGEDRVRSRDLVVS